VRLRLLVPLILAIAAPVAAQSNLTGNWSGTYTYSVARSACSNQTFTSSGNIAFSLLQAGSTLQGRVDFANFNIFTNSCTPTKGEVTSAVVGTFDGKNVVTAFPNSQRGTQISGTAAGDTITAQISDATGATTGSVTITRASASASTDATGTWSGNYSFTDRCANNRIIAYSGSATLGLTQSGTQATGVITLAGVPLYDQNCNKQAALNQSMSVSGAVSGSTFTGGVFDPSGSFEFPIAATLSGDAMSGTVSGANSTLTTGSFTLNRSSSQKPAADFAGSYDGTYNEVDDETSFCLNIGSLRFSGPALISIVQAGSAISGALILQNELTVTSDGFGNCVAINAPDSVIPLFGTLSGNTLTNTVPFGSGAATFTLTLGDTITGNLVDSFGDVAAFSAAKNVLPPPPAPGPRRRAVKP
jgi:hypothetical protein